MKTTTPQHPRNPSAANRRIPNRLLGPCVIASLCAFIPVSAPAEEWTSAENDGHLDIRRGESLVLSWQAKPLAQPTGGHQFAASAFIHPLRTPSGFECTTTQPSDHLHHFGIWWPWKFVEVDGSRYNCWEIQEGQGAHVARSTKRLEGADGRMEWEFINDLEIRKDGQPAQTVLHETARIGVSSGGPDSNILDISLRQRSAGKPLQVPKYRYSGFSWRGPASWNKDNSKMLTSEGRGRDDANGTVARWVMVTGPTPTGTATVLLMSAAAEIAASPEQLRVWDSKAHNGAPFINFNPVMGKNLPLDDQHPAVSHRVYRVVAADRTINAEAAEAAWREWNTQRAKRGD